MINFGYKRAAFCCFMFHFLGTSQANRRVLKEDSELPGAVVVQDRQEMKLTADGIGSYYTVYSVYYTYCYC